MPIERETPTELERPNPRISVETIFHGLDLDNYPPGWTRHVIDDFNPVSKQRKDREIWAPDHTMTIIHERFLEQLYALGVELPYATGGMPGNSPAKNAEHHADNRYFYMLDLKSAYSQIDMWALAHVLVGQGLDNDVNDVLDFLNLYCKVPLGSGLCTGAPSSPMLFNLACEELDRQLGVFADEHGITYTRYLDDLAFSSKDTGFPLRDRIGKLTRQKIHQTVEGCGLVLHPEKTKAHDRHAAPVVITGIQINTSGRWQIPTHYMGYMEEVYGTLLRTLADPETAYLVRPIHMDKASGLYGLLVSCLDHRPDRTPSPREFGLHRMFREIQKLDKRRRIRTGH